MDIKALQELMAQAGQAAEAQAYEEAVRLYSTLLETKADSESAAEKQLRLKAYSERGRLAHLLGRPEAALADYEAYYMEAGNSQRAVDALALIGGEYSAMGNQAKALSAHQEALELARVHNYTAGRAQALGGIGVTSIRLGRPEDAAVNLRMALSLFEQVGDKEQLTINWNRLGVAYQDLGELDKAIVAYEHSYQIATDIEAVDSAIFSLNNLAECHQEFYDMEQALAYHQDALAMAQRTGLEYLATDIGRNIGVELCYLGRNEEGLDFLIRALAGSKETNQVDVTMQVLYSLALAQAEVGKLDEAEQSAQALKNLADKDSARNHQAAALHALGAVAQKRGEIAKAEQFWQQALFLSHETGRRMLLWQLHAALAGVAASADLAAVHKRIATEVIEQIAFPVQDEKLRQKFLQARPVLALLT